MQTRYRPGGPYFEDLEVGQRVLDAPALTLTPAHAALHQAIVGERFRLALDAGLCAAVTGSTEPMVSPLLVASVAIGQSTEMSQRVRANLFYRRLTQLRPVHVGDTLATITQVTALRKNTVRPGKPATGLAVLRITTVNQRDEPVLDFWRCPMLPLADPAAAGDRTDDVTVTGEPAEDLPAVVPAQWRLDAWCRETPGRHGEDLTVGESFEVPGGDVVTSAPELARMTLNLASAHYDPAVSAYGRRLVYGGHTIALAAAALTRALPNVLTVASWRSCDHTGPVFEGDVLRTQVQVEALHPVRDGVALADLQLTTTARADADAERPVLDWHCVALI